jgi:hypothetical protein
MSLRDALRASKEVAAAPSIDVQDKSAPAAAPSQSASTAPTATVTADITPGVVGASDDASDVRYGWTKKRNVPVPNVKAGPSAKVLAIVGGALAVIVLVAVITVVRSQHSTPVVPVLGTTGSSIDACQVVTAAQATAAFGDDAGLPHTVLGECVYADATRELIVEVDRQDAVSSFAANRTSSAQTVAVAGAQAYYSDGKLWVLKGSSLLQLTLGPVPAGSADPVVVKVAQSAVGHL